MSARVSGNTLWGRMGRWMRCWVAKVLGDTAGGIGRATRLGKDRTELGSGDMQLDQL